MYLAIPVTKVTSIAKIRFGQENLEIFCNSLGRAGDPELGKENYLVP